MQDQDFTIDIVGRISIPLRMATLHAECFNLGFNRHTDHFSFPSITAADSSTKLSFCTFQV